MACEAFRCTRSTSCWVPAFDMVVWQGWGNVDGEFEKTKWEAAVADCYEARVFYTG